MIDSGMFDYRELSPKTQSRLLIGTTVFILGAGAMLYHDQMQYEVLATRSCVQAAMGDGNSDWDSIVRTRFVRGDGSMDSVADAVDTCRTLLKDDVNQAISGPCVAQSIRNATAKSRQGLTDNLKLDASSITAPCITTKQ